ncbi:hypothetical protein HMPREF9946_04453 [Acetobacteraceae bacterium AT-5844]|nr:hypothetical protein HMPREF9946_04453 [Acetobacteraceae bacterium AT-5844]
MPQAVAALLTRLGDRLEAAGRCRHLHRLRYQAGAVRALSQARRVKL